MSSSPKREHLIETALKLFGAEGFHATGIDRILDVANVARMTLYHHFSSKNDLIVAALEKQSELIFTRYRKSIESKSDNPKFQILELFEQLEGMLTKEPPAAPTGCIFINALAEFSDPSTRVNQVARRHGRTMHALFEELATAAGYSQPELLAARLMIIHEGAITWGQFTGDTKPAGQARTLVAELLEISSEK